MILPLLVLVADVAAWWLANDITQRNDTGLTLMAFGLALTFLGWFAIEVYQLLDSAVSSRRAGSSDLDDGQRF